MDKKKPYPHAVVQWDMLGLVLKTVCGLAVPDTVTKWPMSWKGVKCKNCHKKKGEWL